MGIGEPQSVTKYGLVWEGELWKGALRNVTSCGILRSSVLWNITRF